MKKIPARIQHRSQTAEAWRAINPILEKGELGIEEDTRNFKFGNGKDHWIDLDYSSNDSPQSTKAIIDCATLPTSNINVNAIYRTNNIQFVFDRQVGVEGSVLANVIVVEDITKLQHTEIIPYATSNPTARNWYYDLSRQHGYCYYEFEVPAADKSNPRYDWIDATAIEGYQWFDPEWIYRDQNGYGGTVASYDEIPATNYKTIYFISKTSLFYYDSNSHQWKHLQEEFVNNTKYDVVPTIMRNSSEVSYKTYTDGAGGSTLALRTGDGFLRARSATSGPGGDWSSPLDDFTLVNKGYLRGEFDKFTEERGLGYEYPETKKVIYSIDNGKISFTVPLGGPNFDYYYLVDTLPPTPEELIGKCISIHRPAQEYADSNREYVYKKYITSADIAKSKKYSGGTYLYDLGIWIVNNYAILGDVNPGFTANGLYFIYSYIEIHDNEGNFPTTHAYPIEIYTTMVREPDHLYIPQHHIVPINLPAGAELTLQSNHKYNFQSGSNSQKIYLGNDSDSGLDACATGQIICGEQGASVSNERNFRALVFGQFTGISIITGKVATSKNLELTPDSYLKNTGSDSCWVWDEYFG